jgi:translation initiation factor IF-1
LDKGEKMAKADVFELNGTVTDNLPGAKFKVLLENGIEIIATISGKIRKNSIRILVGDSVTVEVSAYDPTKGRITWRN